MGCASSAPESETAKAVAREKKSLNAMRTAFPAAFVEAYEVLDCDYYDRYGGAFRVISITDDIERTAKVMRIVEKAEDKDDESMTLAQFNTEEYVLELMHSESVTKLHESFLETRRKPYIGVHILDRVTGDRLVDRAQKKGGKFSEDEARVILTQLAQVLSTLDNLGATCGSLELSTVFFVDNYEDDIMITSMPYCTLVGRDAPFEFRYETYEWLDPETGETVIRTYPFDSRDIRFAAPERFDPGKRRRDLRKPVDCWAFGVIMFTMLAGYRPFDDEDLPTLCERIRRGNFTAFTYDIETWGGISLAAKDLIAGCLRVDPRRRFDAKRIVSHPWLTNATFAQTQSTPPQSSRSDHSVLDEFDELDDEEFVSPHVDPSDDPTARVPTAA